MARQGVIMKSVSTRYAAVAAAMLAGITLFLQAAYATDGIAVSFSRDWFAGMESGYTYNLMKYTVENDKVIAKKVLYRQSWNYSYCVSPVLNASATHAAFLRTTPEGNFLSVVDIEGNETKNIVSFPTTWGNICPLRNPDGRFCDWPVGDWIWYCHDGGEMRKVKYNDPSSEQKVFDFSCTKGTNHRGVWQWQLNADASRICYTGAGDDCYGVGWNDFPWDGAMTCYGGCGTSMSPSGRYRTNFSDANHLRIKIADINADTSVQVDHTQYNTWATDSEGFEGTCGSYPLTVGAGSNYARWSVNSDKWFMTHIGWPPGGRNSSCGSNQVLFNWLDKKAILVSKNRRSCDAADKASACTIHACGEWQCDNDTCKWADKGGTSNCAKRKNGAGDFWVSAPLNEVIPSMRGIVQSRGKKLRAIKIVYSNAPDIRIAGNTLKIAHKDLAGARVSVYSAKGRRVFEAISKDIHMSIVHFVSGASMYVVRAHKGSRMLFSRKIARF
jgi:hypothetical protein